MDDKFVKKPLMDMMKTGMGGIGKLFGLESAEDKKMEAQKAVYEAAEQSDQNMQNFMKANVQQVFVVNWPQQLGGTGGITGSAGKGWEHGLETKTDTRNTGYGPNDFDDKVGGKTWTDSLVEQTGLAKKQLASVGIAAVATFSAVYAATGDWKKSMIATFLQMFVQIMMMKMMAVASGGLIGSAGAYTSVAMNASGGRARHMVPGGTALRDRVPALLEPGEFVIRKPMAKAIGGPALQRMNATGQTPGNVEVNITNKGTPQTTQKSDIKFDPKGMIVNIVLDDMKNNGPIRQSMRSGGRR